MAVCADECCPANEANADDEYPLGIPPQHKEFGKDVGAAFASVTNLARASLSPLPRYPNASSNDNDADSTGVLGDLLHMGFPDVMTAIEGIKSWATGGPVNDNKLETERIIQMAAKLKPTSKAAADISDAFIKQLWDDLPHPPVASLGSEFKYRSADGKNNNLQHPDLGKAGQPYARSTRPQVFQNVSLPDPGLIFDSLFARGENEFEAHPNKISSQLFYFATIIVHDLFETDRQDQTRTNTSSYLDLAPLYGNNQQQQDSVRTFRDGKLKPDCFTDKRILGFPPGIGVFLIMFNRFHNYVATQLALINEDINGRGRFTRPDNKAAKEAWEKYDNDLFQTARLITGGLYVNIVLYDYVRTILDLNRTNSAWSLDPRVEERQSIIGKGASEAQGNQVSAEFNLIYRWHSPISPKDAKWTEGIYNELFPGKDPNDLSIPELMRGLSKLENSLDPEPSKRPFANLKRKPDGTFDDDALVDILVSGIEDVSGSFGANRIPAILRSVEILGIMQARSWNLATLNEFRAFFNLTKHETFEDINPDPDAAATLKNLYGHPDFVELYPGLVAERAKPPMTPGSGICLNYTISRAILSDAVALVRSDRFLTVDYTPKLLTNWGFNEVSSNPTTDLGHVMYKLIGRAFPKHFSNNSIYAHYPFVVPSENKVIQENLGNDGLYDWSKPSRCPDVIPVTSYAAVTKIMGNKKDWRVVWGNSIDFLASNNNIEYGHSFCLSGDRDGNQASRDNLMKAFYPPDWDTQVEQFYKVATNGLMKKYSYKIAGANQVDIVRDVFNLVHTQFSAELFSLPLKTKKNPKGIYTEQQLYKLLAVAFTFIFYDVDAANSFALHQASRTLIQQLGKLVSASVGVVTRPGLISNIVSRFQSHSTLSVYGAHMIQRLHQGGVSREKLVWNTIMPTVVAGVANSGQLFSQTLDYFLGEGAHFIPELYRLSKRNTPEADEVLLRYFMEGSRLSHTVGVLRDNAGIPRIFHCQKGLNCPSTVSIPHGARVFCNLRAASLDPDVFPNPYQIDLERVERNPELYIHYGWGPHKCLGLDVSKTAAVQVFKIIFGLKNLRRAPGPLGRIKKVDMAAPGQVFGGPGAYVGYMTADQSSLWPFPSTMQVQWDDEEEEEREEPVVLQNGARRV